MKTNGQITAALLVATLAAAGCSSTGETPQSQREQATPVSMTNSPPPRPAADKTAIGPVSFADGEAAYRAGNYKDAENVFERYTKEQPDNAWGHFMYGLSASKSGDPAKAEIAFEEALRLDPNHVKSMTNLSRVLIDQKRFEEAFEKLTHAVEKEPDSAEVHRLLGRTYSGQGKTEDAIESYRRAIELDDKDAWSMNNLGLLFLKQDRPYDAVPLLAKAVLLNKHVAMFQNNLGMALEHTGRFGAAAIAYSGALKADPNDTKAQKNLERVQAVKAGPEEPFDLEALAGGHLKQTKVDETNSAR
ncbi:MAG: hypothetical protein DMG13_06895 [Acidobacteria bacterium]|nr:MAG: hypothetical protein DMG13_06895 [Acidobacteriota bacterium]